MTNPFVIPEDILHAAYAHARAAYPAECCGWMTGPSDGDAVDSVRTCVNQVASSVAYTMSEADVLELAESLGGDEPARIIFHSHPNSDAFFSSIDHYVATLPFGNSPTYPVQQLVIGLNGGRIKSSVLFAWCEEAKGFEMVNSFDGADL